MIVSASAFHPLRGHVAEGTIIRLPDNSTLRIEARTRGWVLVDETGNETGPITADAQELTRQIIERAHS